MATPRSELEALISKGDVPRDEVIWDELKWYEDNHGTHGSYDFEVEREDGKVVSVIVTCDPRLSFIRDCDHHNNEVTGELAFSILYHPRPIIETGMQRARREGTLEAEYQ